MPYAEKAVVMPFMLLYWFNAFGSIPRNGVAVFAVSAASECHEDGIRGEA